MRAKTVDFQRTGNSKKGMKVGVFKPLEPGDGFELLDGMYWHDFSRVWVPESDLTDKQKIDYRSYGWAYINKGDIIKLEDRDANLGWESDLPNEELRFDVIDLTHGRTGRIYAREKFIQDNIGKLFEPL